MTISEKLYNQGIEISKNYDNRDLEATKILYVLLQEASLKAQIGLTQKEKDRALTFLVEVFTPLVTKVASKIYQKYNSAQEYEDVLQDTYLTYILLIKKYDYNKATFAYFIKDNLERSMNTHAKRYYSTNTIPTDSVELETMMNESLKEKREDPFNAFDELILKQEYDVFIKEQAEKKSKTDTNRIVCERYFLGKETVQTIANDMGLSYQAIYLITKRIKKELEYFFHYSKFSDYVKETNLSPKKKNKKEDK